MTTRWDATLPIAAAIALGLATLAVLWLLARPLAILVLAILLVYAVLGGIVLVIGCLMVPRRVAPALQLIRAAPDLLSSTRQWLGKWEQKTGGELSNTVASRTPGSGNQCQVAADQRPKPNLELAS